MSVIGRLPEATTRLAAVIGEPVRHSLSPVLLNAAFSECGLDWVYCAFEVPRGSAGDAIAAMRSLPLWGLNVTMPHKEAVVAHLDAVSPEAERLGAVNCVVWESSRLVGHSTDGAGLIDTLARDQDFDPEHKRCVVIGAGGAARAAVAALADAGAAEVIVVNRTAERAEGAARLASGRGRVGRVDDVTTGDLIVNATPMGMAVDGTPALPFDPELISPHQLLLDMVYDPPVTPIVAAARDRGAPATGGLGMLVHQAARAFSLWTSQAAPIEAMAAAATAELARGVG